MAAVLSAALAVPACSQGLEHLGPAPTRDQFPLNLLTLTYTPVAPDPLEPGAWQADLETVQANTLEFSDLIKDQLAANPNVRVDITRERAQELAQSHPELPVIFLFQMETNLTTLRLRRGLRPGLEGWIELPVLSYSGGFEDGLINGVHSLGFYQTGRSSLPINQVRMVVIQHGQLAYYNEESMPARMQDPVLGLTQSLVSGPSLSLAASAKLKPAITHSLVGVKSGWDWGFQLSGRWSPSPTVDCYFGGGGVHRDSGSYVFNQFGFRDQYGLHAGIEGRRTSSWRPFLQLLFLTGASYPTAGQKLGLCSLQHDLGVHWVYRPGLVFTFRYMNNITNNENTADMALSLEATLRFGGS